MTKTYTNREVDKMEQLIFEKMEKSDILLAIIKALDVDTKGDIYEYIIRTHEIQKPRFEVEIVETLTRTVVVEASDEEEAEEKVKELRYNGDIILDADDFVDYEINVIGETEEEEDY